MTNKRKRKPKVDRPPSQYAIKVAASRARSREKRESRQTEEACTVDPEETCCDGHDCVHTYPVDVIQRLRKYLNMQSFPVRRAFIADRTLYTGFEKEQVKKGDRLQVFHKENADVLSTRLEIALANTRQLPPPGVNPTCVQCASMVFFISLVFQAVFCTATTSVVMDHPPPRWTVQSIQIAHGSLALKTR